MNILDDINYPTAVKWLSSHMGVTATQDDTLFSALGGHGQPVYTMSDKSWFGFIWNVRLF